MRDKQPRAGQAGPKTHPQAVQQAEYFDDEIDLRELLMKIVRRRLAILGIFLLAVVLTALYLYQATPLYTAQTQLTLDLRKSRVVDVEEVLSGLSPDASVIGTELDIIRSSTLLERVVDKLKLQSDPEFNPLLLDDGGESMARRAVTWLRELWFLESEALEELDPREAESRLRMGIVRRLQAGLKVEHRRQSHTINISFTSQSPRGAAQVANTLAELYLTDQLEAKFEASRRANEWLAERLGKMRLEVQAAEQAVKRMRDRGDLVPARGGTLLQQQLGDINAQLVEARVKISRAEARYRSGRELMDRPGGMESIGEVMDSRNIQQLRSEETSLRRKRAELSQRYGPRHPQMIQVEAELKDLQDKLNEEVGRILQSLENEVQVARAAENALRHSLDELRLQAGQAMEVELELRELERQAESARTLYLSFLSRFQETRDHDALQRPDARIISPAEVPVFASYPRKKMTLILGGLVGLLFGVMGAFILEMLDRGYRTGDQLETATGLTVLGMVPLLGRGQGTPMEFVQKKPFSALAESLRAIRNAIHLANVDRPPRTIMVTSSLPSEGKTSFCLALGRISAASGAKTLVIDADLRRPSVAKAFPELEAEARLEDLLQGRNELEQAIVTDRQSGLDLLMAHGRSPAVGEMLGSQRMKKLLAGLEETYNLIIIDTPPIMGVSDAWGLAREVDAVIFMTRWAETPRDTVRAALHQMENLDIQVSGLVLSMVNLEQQARYGYGGYGYYYGKYKDYYHE